MRVRGLKYILDNFALKALGVNTPGLKKVFLQFRVPICPFKAFG